MNQQTGNETDGALPRLTAAALPAGTATWPGYVPEAHGTGIVHLGIGAFARAHLAAYTDAALAHAGGDWRIVGVSLRGTTVADTLNPQDGRYALVERAGLVPEVRVIGALSSVIADQGVHEKALAAMVSERCRIVSLTVTEKGYGLLMRGGLDLSHPNIAADLAAPEKPTGVIGLIALALRKRFDQGVPPFTVLSCDNLPSNGRLVKQAVVDYAGRAFGQDLAARIADEVAFPSTVVDRITPASTAATRFDASAAVGLRDEAAVECEAFCQWIIEDDFPTGRPAWQTAGARFVPDVSAFERMKLRMLNGCHSMMAYGGFLSGHRYVRDVMTSSELTALALRHMRAAAMTVPLDGQIKEDYAQALLARFANPAIAHETRQIAMDGSLKMPVRIFEPAHETLEAGGDIRPFAFATALWLRYLCGSGDDGSAYPINDPAEQALCAAIDRAGGNAAGIFDGVFGDALRGVLPPKLADGTFRREVERSLEMMLVAGVAETIQREAAGF